MPDEIWRTLVDFPRYEISNLGRIYNTRRRIFMRPSRNQHGRMKISLRDEFGNRRDRSVALLVAQNFVIPPNFMCDEIILLDGDPFNTAAHNIAWRPRWFAWLYAHQFKEEQPAYFYNLPVINLTSGKEYKSIIEAGTTEGLLFEKIWESTYTANETYPDGSIFRKT